MRRLERDLATARRGGTGVEAVVPNPKLKLMDQMREVLRLRVRVSGVGGV